MTTTLARIDLAEKCLITKDIGWGPQQFERRAWEIIEIRDTRMIDDEWKPIGGTGDSVDCDCCGRAIEVHATVSHRITGEERTVGTQCAKKAEMSYRMMSPATKSNWKRNFKKAVR